MIGKKQKQTIRADYEAAVRRLWSYDTDLGSDEQPRGLRRRNAHIELHLLFGAQLRASPETTLQRPAEDREEPPSIKELLDIAEHYWRHYRALSKERRYADLFAAHDHYTARFRKTETRVGTLDDLHRFALRVWRLLHVLGGRYGSNKRIRECVSLLSTDEEREEPSWHETHVGPRRRALQLRLGDGEDRAHIEDDRHLACHTFDLEATWGEAAKKLVAISDAVWDDLVRATHDNDRVKFIQRLLRSLVRELDLQGSVRTWSELHRSFIVEDVIDKAMRTLQRRRGVEMNALIAYAIIQTDPTIELYKELRPKLGNYTGHPNSVRAIKTLVRSLFPDIYEEDSFAAFKACLRAYVRLLADYIGEKKLSEPFGPTGIYGDLKWPGL